MKKIHAISSLTCASIMLSACGASSDMSQAVSYPIQNTQGAKIGTLTLTQIEIGGVNVDVDVSGLEPGTRAMHFHEFGKCDGPDFKSAGGHYNPTGVSHGQVDDGPHVGDMMNVEVGADGKGQFVFVNDKVNLIGGDLPPLMDSDGSALIIHGGADDYESQPSGAAGPRVACAIIPAG
jgi:Cu-Zn family superoxide dismutase